jgi:hypothetical protein
MVSSLPRFLLPLFVYFNPRCHLSSFFLFLLGPTKGTSELPVMMWDIDAVPREGIIDYLKENFCDIDMYRTRLELAELCAFMTLIHEKLAPAISYLQWIDKDNYAYD